MRYFLLSICLLLSLSTCKSTQPVAATPTPSPARTILDPIAAKTKGMQHFDGYFPFWWEARLGKIWMEVSRLDEEFLYVNSLPAGLGSNDIGLDRGQLGETRIVKFVRVGTQVLLVQPNYKFRAVTDNPDEKKSVEEAFAQSVLWGFRVGAADGDRVLLDVTAFVLRDAHRVHQELESGKQGKYKLSPSRSAIYLPSTKNFPKNTELEGLLTFVGEPKGKYIREVSPTPSAVSVRQRHSFIELPDDEYQPRPFDPRSGYISLRFKDYASPISAPLETRYLLRHRLKKENPSAARSKAVEPIVYYVDRGAPEPIRSALIEGARWWNQAFEAAGYIDAFRVELLPEGVDMMDVRYNVIQWVHRSTRGWSYGSNVHDPRTGEIIKGHVSLGSLRVRQDFLIAQGILDASQKEVLEKMALARLRQLSAHEVGHTIGLVHNFAASVNGRASVMDYPHPLITIGADGAFDFSKAYDDKIGGWDKRVIEYGYQDFPKETNEAEALRRLLDERIQEGYGFVSDEDARPAGGAHSLGHLWDNGADAVVELNRLMEVRKKALQKFGLANLAAQQPLASLEEVLAPLYLMHRYQIEGVAKIIGGLDYSYAVKGDQQVVAELLAPDQQKAAIDALLNALQPEQLLIPEHILALLPPKPPGYYRSRESFQSHSGRTFDPITAAEGLANHILHFLLHPQRAARLITHHARNNQQPSLSSLIDALIDQSWKQASVAQPTLATELRRMTANRTLQHLFELAADKSSLGQASAIAWLKINELEKWMLLKQNTPVEGDRAHYSRALEQIRQFRLNPNDFQPVPAKKLPDGSPIGCY